MKKRSATRERGFTLVEIMVVLTIIAILLAIAMPIYSRSLKKAREDAFRQNLETLNKVIVQYTLDKQKAPKSLDDLVQAGYLNNPIPDDITGRNDTWATEEEDTIMSPDQKDTGIIGVHSGSNAIGSDGRAYSEW